MAALSLFVGFPMHMVLKYLERSKEVITARLIESQGLVRGSTPPPG